MALVLLGTQKSPWYILTDAIVIIFQKKKNHLMSSIQWCVNRDCEPVRRRSDQWENDLIEMKNM